MSTHIKRKHERDPVRPEILVKCSKKVIEYQGFIDPWFFLYKGRTMFKTSAPATATKDPGSETSAPTVQSDVDMLPIQSPLRPWRQR